MPFNHEWTRIHTNKKSRIQSLPMERFERSATGAAGPVAAGGGAEAVENILRRGFANVLRLIPPCGNFSREVVLKTYLRLNPSNSLIQVA